MSKFSAVLDGGPSLGVDDEAMTITAGSFAFGDTVAGRPVVDVEIVIPVYNESGGLERSVRRLHAFLEGQFPLSWSITVVDNASTDQTWGVACRLAGELLGVRAVHLDQKGRGRALRAAWSDSPARAVAYMDVDLSTRLEALLPLVAPLLSGHSDLAIGSRLATGARTRRGLKRELISRGYNLILKVALGNGFSDAQCGFKAARTDVARALLPLVEDEGWFFDTELLVVAEHNGLRIHEVPVDWVDDPDSRVGIVDTALADLKGICRVIGRFARGRATLPDGVLSGPGTELRSGRVGRLFRLVVAALPPAATVGTLAVLAALGVTSLGAELLALTLVNASAIAARFALLRHRVFAP